MIVLSTQKKERGYEEGGKERATLMFQKFTPVYKSGLFCSLKSLYSPSIGMDPAFHLNSEGRLRLYWLIIILLIFKVLNARALTYSVNSSCQQFYGQTSVQRLIQVSDIIQKVVNLAKDGKYGDFEYRATIDEAMYLLTRLELEWYSISRMAINTTNGINLPIVIKNFMRTMLATHPKWDLRFDSKLQEAEAFAKEIESISNEVATSLQNRLEDPTK